MTPSFTPVAPTTLVTNTRTTATLLLPQHKNRCRRIPEGKLQTQDKRRITLDDFVSVTKSGVRSGGIREGGRVYVTLHRGEYTRHRTVYRTGGRFTQDNTSKVYTEEFTQDNYTTKVYTKGGDTHQHQQTLSRTLLI